MRGLLGDWLCDLFGIHVDVKAAEAEAVALQIEQLWNDPAARIWIDDGKQSVSPLKGGGFLVDRSIAIPRALREPCTHQHAFRGTCLTCGEENVG